MSKIKAIQGEAPGLIEMKDKELLALLDRLESGELSVHDRQLLRDAALSLVWMSKQVRSQAFSMAKLRRLFGFVTEKAAKLGVETDVPKSPVVDVDGADDDDEPPPSPGGGGGKRKGHGRRKAADYPAAKQEEHPHPDLAKGDCCPDCLSAKLYALPPGSVLRLSGQPPIMATVHRPERLRCKGCGTVFTAPLPPSVPATIADATAKSLVSLLHYGFGMPFHRLARLQASLGVPLSDATQWDMIESAARIAMKIWRVLKRLAAAYPVIYQDDTTGRVSELRKKIIVGLESDMTAEGDTSQADDDEFDLDPKRRGIFTTGLVAKDGEREIYLYFTGRRHAGENLAALLGDRPPGLAPPIQMCDALSRNLPKNFKTVLAKCLTHGRRNFVDALAAFPAECGHVIAELALVYHHDSIATAWNMTAKERLAFHRDQSGPVMARLWLWMDERLARGVVEENSGLGQAITYMRRHWPGLTTFLEVEGAPLANDLVERALKWAIQYRKNSLQYRTTNGALVGDIMMSVIRTTIAAARNPVDYLTALQRNASAVIAAPEQWLPWNYPVAVAS